MIDIILYFYTLIDNINQPIFGGIITLTQLEYIVAIFNEGSFHKAAKACYVTQPTLSIQVKKIENEIQLIIFDRNKSPIIPTRDGQLIINQAIKVIDEFSKIKTIANETREEIKGDYHIAIIPSIMDTLLPLFLKKFTSKNPNVKLHIHESKTDDMISQLNKNIIDVGIAALPLHEDHFEEDILYHEAFLGLVPPGHKLFKNKHLTERSIDGEKVLILNEGHCFRTQILDLCKINLKNNGHFKFDGSNFQTLINLTEEGLGMTILPELVAKKIQSNKLKKMIKTFSGKIPVREVGFIYKKSYAKKKILQALRQSILTQLPPHFLVINKNQKVLSPTKNSELI